VFDIELEQSAVTAAIDGQFRSGPLQGCIPEAGGPAGHERIQRARLLPGADRPASAALTSRGGTRPWRIDHVYLFHFHAPTLLTEQQSRGVKTGVAASVRKARWNAGKSTRSPETRCFRSANGKRSYCDSSHRPDRRAQPATLQYGPQSASSRPLGSTTAQPRPTANGRIRPDTTGPEQDQPLTALIQVRGRLSRLWQVLGSNQRRLSRRFYRPLPLATRATCLASPEATAQ
jgi:hypothetical protein